MKHFDVVLTECIINAGRYHMRAALRRSVLFIYPIKLRTKEKNLEQMSKRMAMVVPHTKVTRAPSRTPLRYG
jgi:hypothetical protein